jgi:putative flavoprotein involved in K+ transport
MSTSLIPELGNRLDRSVPQLHSLDYRCPEDIKTSRVLIVGSGSSGVQICTEFCKSNRFEELHLATSNVLVLPEHVLGIQVHRFLHFFGLFDARVRSPLGKLMYGRIELKGDPIRPPTPKDLARDGRVILHERLTESEGRTLGFKDGSSISTENLTILWCTGYKGAYGWIHAKAGSVEFDERGYPKHERGVIEGCPGLYFVGLRYQYTVASHDIYGVGRDAKYVAERIAASLARSLPTRVPLPNVSSTRKAA